MGFSTTQNSVFLIEADPPFDRLEIQFMPQNISWQRSARINGVAVVGRNNDQQQYTGGEDKLSFKLDFYADNEGNGEDVLRKVNWIKSLAYRDGNFGPARNVKFVIGRLFREHVWAVKSVSINYDQFMPNHEFLPWRAGLTVSLVLDPSRNLTINDVRNI